MRGRLAGGAAGCGGQGASSRLAARRVACATLIAAMPEDEKDKPKS